MTNLLDGNVLVALAVAEHVHHDAVHRWRADHRDERFATCPITQGTLLRLLLREGQERTSAIGLLDSIVALAEHEFWSDDLSYVDVRFDGVAGHRQVTDAYLAHLTRARGGSLVTLDSGLAALHSDVAVLVPTS